MFLFKRLAWFGILLSLAWYGQSGYGQTSELNRRLENQIRSTFEVRPSLNVMVGQRKPSEFTGYDTLPVTISSSNNSTTINFLISKDNKTLVRLQKTDLSDDPMKRIDVQGRPVRGQRDAKVTIINYDDFQCPFCARMHQTLFPGIFKTYGDRVKIIYKDYPLFAIHPWALHAAIDANCLAAQNNDAYWGFADSVHGSQREMGSEKGADKQFARLDSITQEQGRKFNLDENKLNACVKAQSDKAVRNSESEGTALGVDSTPTLFINGEKISGALPEEEVRMVIDRALRDAGQAPPGPPAEAVKNLPKPAK